VDRSETSEPDRFEGQAIERTRSGSGDLHPEPECDAMEFGDGSLVFEKRALNNRSGEKGI
jgi:hypothetical protein